ncbi:hypothetical protein CTI12_AA535360 [Artemisia annua]|uniref:Uncharacterized protein n=1 Tax=Artemisia annua TaxID=35608 RepID=A0A2U1L1G6_ARTAN|nr:hypothetical protein CTI12_AA535360 [Artemisia annua]
MASSLVKRVASNLMRVKAMASSSRLLNTNCFQYDQCDNGCILKCDDRGRSFVRGVVHDAFNPHHSPAANLGHLLNRTDFITGFKYGYMLPLWYVVEDDKALYLLRGMPPMHKEFMDEISKLELKEYVPQYEFMFAIHPDDVKDSVRDMNLSFHLHVMRGVDSEPSGYYYHVLQDIKERTRLIEPLSGSTYVVTMPYHVSYKLQNPQAIRIIMGVAGRTNEGRETDDPFQGYAMEIFLPDRLYNIQDAMTDKTESLWKIIIPKKKGEWTQTIGGNLLFFRETQICKPTLWRPT